MGNTCSCTCETSGDGVVVERGHDHYPHSDGDDTSLGIEGNAADDRRHDVGRPFIAVVSADGSAPLRRRSTSERSTTSTTASSGRTDGVAAPLASNSAGNQQHDYADSSHSTNAGGAAASGGTNAAQHPSTNTRRRSLGARRLSSPPQVAGLVAHSDKSSVTLSSAATTTSRVLVVRGGGNGGGMADADVTTGRRFSFDVASPSNEVLVASSVRSSSSLVGDNTTTATTTTLVNPLLSRPVASSHAATSDTSSGGSPPPPLLTAAEAASATHPTPVRVGVPQGGHSGNPLTAPPLRGDDNGAACIVPPPQQTFTPRQPIKIFTSSVDDDAPGSFRRQHVARPSPPPPVSAVSSAQSTPRGASFSRVTSPPPRALDAAVLPEQHEHEQQQQQEQQRIVLVPSALWSADEGDAPPQPQSTLSNVVCDVELLSFQRQSLDIAPTPSSLVPYGSAIRRKSSQQGGPTSGSVNSSATNQSIPLTQATSSSTFGGTTGGGVGGVPAPPPLRTSNATANTAHNTNNNNGPMVALQSSYSLDTPLVSLNNDPPLVPTQDVHFPPPPPLQPVATVVPEVAAVLPGVLEPASLASSASMFAHNGHNSSNNRAGIMSMSQHSDTSRESHGAAPSTGGLGVPLLSSSLHPSSANQHQGGDGSLMGSTSATRRASLSRGSPTVQIVSEAYAMSTHRTSRATPRQGQYGGSSSDSSSALSSTERGALPHHHQKPPAGPTTTSGAPVLSSLEATVVKLLNKRNAAMQNLHSTSPSSSGTSGNLSSHTGATSVTARSGGNGSVVGMHHRSGPQSSMPRGMMDSISGAIGGGGGSGSGLIGVAGSGYSAQRSREGGIVGISDRVAWSTTSSYHERRSGTGRASHNQPTHNGRNNNNNGVFGGDDGNGERDEVPEISFLLPPP